MQVFDFFIPSHLKFGIDSINRVGGIVSSIGNKVLLVTESGLQGGKMIARIQALLTGRKCDVILFSDVKPTASSETVEKGAFLARSSYCNVIVGVGGVRTLSIAKSIAMLASNPASINDYIDGEIIKEPSISYVEIPTAPRNPFMFRNDFFLLDQRTRKTHVLNAVNGQPRYVIYDPSVTSDMAPEDLSLMMIDTLANAIEGYLSSDSSFLSDMMFLKAIEVLTKYLIPAVQEHDTDAASFLSLAGLMTSMGLSTASTGIVSAVSYVISSMYKIHKSNVAAILLPYAMEFYIPACAEKLVRIAAAMGVSVESMTLVEAAVKSIEQVRLLTEKLKFPTKLSSFSLEADELISAADEARKMDMMNYLPRTCSCEELYSILQSAL